MRTSELVRWAIEPLDGDRRSLDGRLALLAPAAIRRLSAAVLRLPAGSRIRKVMLSRGLRVGLAAANRGDYDLQFVSYAPDVEVHNDYRWSGIDIDPVDHGTDGLRRVLDRLKGGFAELRWEPREVLDAGSGRFAVRVDLVGVGRGGIETRQEAWHVVVVERGLIVRQHVLSTEEEALAALAQPRQTLPSRAR